MYIFVVYKVIKKSTSNSSKSRYHKKKNCEANETASESNRSKLQIWIREIIIIIMGTYWMEFKRRSITSFLFFLSLNHRHFASNDWNCYRGSQTRHVANLPTSYVHISKSGWFLMFSFNVKKLRTHPAIFSEWDREKDAAIWMGPDSDSQRIRKPIKS